MNKKGQGKILEQGMWEKAHEAISSELPARNILGCTSPLVGCPSTLVRIDSTVNKMQSGSKAQLRDTQSATP